MSSDLAWGADIGGTTTIVGCVDRDSVFHAEAELRTLPSEGPGRLLDELAHTILRLDPEPAAIGVGIAGLIDRAGGTLVFSPNLGGWDGLEVATSLRALTGASVVVDNDCNAFAFGAVESGLMPRTGLQVFITIGTGIGGTIVVDGSILYGTGFAGEFGHMAVEASGMPCPCGSTGCWERYAGRAALIRYYLDGAPAGSSGEPDPREIAALAGKGDGRALAAFDTFGTWIGRGLASLANCLSPAGFFVAGGLTNALPFFAATAEAEYGRRCRHPWHLSVIPGTTEAGARGAALMARKSVR